MKSVPRTLESRFVSGRESDLYVKTGLRIKTANYEQFCCVSKHTQTIPRGRICWRRRCYSGCEMLIPLPRVSLASRVPSHGSVVPAAWEAAGGAPRSPPAPGGGVASRGPLPVVRCRYRKLFRLLLAVEADTGRPDSSHCRGTHEHEGFAL